MSKRSASDEPGVTISIDFGTAGTGYAYCFDSAPGVIEAREPGGQQARKTLTCLLLDERGDFVNFGDAARQQYYEDHEESPGLLLFTNYKMHLHSADSSAPVTKASNGVLWPLKDVIMQTLRYVKEEALKEVSKAQPHAVQAHEVKWVVTVPAIWGDSSKGFMRETAHLAGLIRERASPLLVLALEPEAGCVACETDASHLKAGDGALILDCGGGTVDVTGAWRRRLVSPHTRP